MKEFTLKLWIKILAWISAAIIVYLNIHLVIDEIFRWINNPAGNKIIIYAIVIPVILACFVLLAYVFIHPFLTSKVEKISQLPHGQAEGFISGPAIQYNNIGIAIDFTGNDLKLIKNAINQGGKSATYTFIHVVESAAARYLGKNAMDYETNLDRDSLTKYQADLNELGYQANVQIGFGNAASEITKIIRSQNIDLLVMGVHGHKGFKDLIFGTTVDSVRHKTKIPLLIIT